MEIAVALLTTNGKSTRILRNVPARKRDCRQREKGLATSRPTHGGPASAEWSSLLSRGRSNLSWRQLLASRSLFVSV